MQRKKSLGQNFLIDNLIIDKIIDSCKNLSTKNVIEIGPGRLALTKHLAKKSSSLLLVEKDIALKQSIDAFAKENNVKYIFSDAMLLDIQQHISHNTILVSNLPYNVGTKIYLKFAQFAYVNPNSFDYFIIMLQKEVASRIAANVGDANYGRLSIISQLYAEERDVLFDVPPESFSPKPKVVSSVLRIIPRQKPMNVDINKLNSLLILLFNKRRKSIGNILKDHKDALRLLNIDLLKRPQEISLHECIDLVKSINH